MKKLSGIAIVILWVIPFLLMRAPAVNGDAELPEWIVGGRWEYETPYYGLTMKETTEVIDITTIDVNGSNYEVYVVLTTSSSLPWGDFDSYNYISVIDMAIVKTRWIQSYGNNSTETVTTYQPPKKEFDFPLQVGKSWFSSYTRYQDSGSLGYINATDTLHYNITKIENIKVKAGTFECYVIEEYSEWGDLNKITWYSEKVKNSVKIEDYGRIIIESELTSYSVKGVNGEEEIDIITIFFIILIIFIPIILILLVNTVVGRRKKKEAESAQITTKSQADLYTRKPKSFIPLVSKSPGDQQNPCPTCGQSSTFIQRYNKWYCFNCEKYI